MNQSKIAKERTTILYVTDLDGTLLRSDETTSTFTNESMNQLVKQGMLFSYATARSFQTSHKVTAGLEAKIPLIIYNGAIIVDNVTGEVIDSNFFERTEIREIIEELSNQNVYPLVYSYIQEVEKFSYVESLISKGIQAFLNTREGDKRANPVQSVETLSAGDCFYVTCIDEKEKLEPIYNAYKDRFHCVFHADIYLHNQWLEIMPLKASKANAIKQLKERLNCDKLIVFGDGKNDIDMFELADEKYAVSNAVEELKNIATGILGSNDEDAVAKWLLENYR